MPSRVLRRLSARLRHARLRHARLRHARLRHARLRHQTKPRAALPPSRLSALPAVPAMSPPASS
ncbi:pentapeptide repeat-containing protein [Xanthobacter autotrophicus]|uniref:pentapeptide repeat-containing protein n=1 Tax=Xanthobacter TaxID=279 RepID=UPI0024ABAC2D|nr:pentapeptide repeat-containing protein [Xanthobacter autotrophicus]